MATLFESPDETRRSYHSGLSGRVVDVADLIDVPQRVLDPQRRTYKKRIIALETKKYPGPKFRLTLRTSLDWTRDYKGEYVRGRWLFELPGSDFPGEFEMKFMLDGHFWQQGPNLKMEFYEAKQLVHAFQVLFAYDVQFSTKWKPNHLVTFRNSVDGWQRDIFGVYRDNAWRFLFDRAAYPAMFEAKLMLDQWQWQGGSNMVLNSSNPNVVLNDGNVFFAGTPSAFQHGYDNLMAVENALEQSVIGLPGREDTHYDVILIGSGMAGGTLADALSDRGAKVLVLDTGGLRLPVHMNELPRSDLNFVGRDEVGHYVNGGEPWFAQGVHFNLGGRSTYWSGLIPRMTTWEMRSVWPQSVKDYLTIGGGYDKAETLLRKQVSLGPFQDQVKVHLTAQIGADFEVLDLPRSLHQPNMAASGALQNVLQRSTGGFSTADLLLDSVGHSGPAGRDNLRINLHHLVKSIEWTSDTATAVICEDLVGHLQRRYTAQYIVMCCGSIEGPKLALNSSLTDNNHKIGIGLTDHPAYFYKVYHDLPTAGAKAWLGDKKGHAKILLRHKNATAAQHAYNIELLLNARYWDARHSDDELWKTRVETNDPSKVEIKFIFDSLLMDVNTIVPQGTGQKPIVSVFKNESAAAYKAEMVAKRNQVLLAVGIPAADLTANWEDWQWSQGIYGTVHHAGGSMRMSHDHSGVVDEDLKFEQYQNLYCCDASVFPSIPAANPSLTLVALAQRLADELATKLGL